MKGLELIRLLKLAIFAVIITWVVANPVLATDSLRTVREFGFRVFNNLNIPDTLNGHDRLDSIEVQRCVRDAAVDVGTLVPTEKAKTIVTVSGTFGYLVDTHLDSVQAVMVKKTKKGILIDVVPWYKIMEALKLEGTPTDDASIKYATVHGDSVYLYPVPASPDTVYLFYTARGTVPTAHSSVVDLPHELYSAVEYLATLRAAKILTDPIAEESYSRAYGEAIAKFIGGKNPQ